MHDVKHGSFSPVTDDVVVLRPLCEAELATPVAGRDAEFDRWLGAESEMDPPFAGIVVGDLVVGWIDFDIERARLEHDEVNIGYFLLAPARGHGYATRSVELLLQVLVDTTAYRVATLLIASENQRSLAVARRAGFEAADDIGGGALYFKRRIGPAPASDESS